MSGTRRAPALGGGARIHVVAPSGPVPAERLDRGLRALRGALGAMRPELVLAPNVHAQTGYFAGTDAERLAALQSAIGDESSGAILCARGGYGATRLLPNLDPAPLERAPRLLAGFSDITALLCWAHTRAGLVSIHGPVVTQMSTVDREDLERFETLVTGGVPPPLVADEGTTVSGGRIEGPLFAGNLEVLRSLIGTRYMPSFAGGILALEEVGERPYRIDRSLTQLLACGALRGVRGFAIGRLTACDEPDHGYVQCPSAHDVVLERLETLGVPIVTGFPFGHESGRNAPLPFGAMARLDADAGALEFLEPVTA